MAVPFTHLNVKSHYSLLESTIRIGDYLAAVKAGGGTAAALTDRGNMFGAVDFYLAAKAQDIKPILGCEVSYVAGSCLSKPDKKARKAMLPGSEDDDEHRAFSLVLLASNAEGYRSLCRLVTKSYSDGLYMGRPRADRELLAKHSEGLIALTSSIRGEVPYHFARGRPEKAEVAAEFLKKTYGDNLFFELQESGLPEQSAANGAIVDLADRWGMPLVATACAHMMKPEGRMSLEAMMCIQLGRNLNVFDEAASASSNLTGYYLKSPDEMAAQFAWRPDAVANTQLVADRCKFSFKLKDDQGRPIYHIPQFTTPGGESAEDFMQQQAEEGLKERFEERIFAKPRAAPDWEEKKKTYEARLDDELKMIARTGFSGYFLIVSDFIKHAKAQGIPVGPGRGSGAGSLVAYALKITDVDPIPLNLLFERFINPERVSMPDFDVDFCQERRGEVIAYVVDKYGKDCVSQIVTFGKLLARSVIKDAGRVLGLTFQEMDVITKLIPETLGITLEDAFKKEVRLKEMEEQNPTLQRLFEIARTLEGLNRNAGIHAAGIVITNKPLTEYCPLMVGKENEAVVQYDKDYAEKIGLVKFDFLGLKTLTVIDNAVKFIRRGPKADFHLSEIDFDDKGVYELLASGDTDGVFQLESSGMKDLCSRVMPNSLEDITAINALYRPGPLESGMVDDFINRKHGRVAVEYTLPQLEEILRETYGVIVYQEQVMRVARVLAGYSLGEADILRRAMGKKKPEEMAKQKGKFIEGCIKNNVPPDKADFIFELLSKFAAYGFNKSHSAAYGVLSFQTAYLKRYYPAQFMAALMATEINDTDKLSQYVADARTRGIQVLPPHINESLKSFSVQGRDIRFGLEAVKGVGGVAVEALIAERDKAGPFKSLVDFCKRVTLRKVNKKVIESLIAAGAFDTIAEENRATLFESLEAVMKYAAGHQEQQDLGQVSMFDDFRATDLNFQENTDALFTRVQDWPESKKLQEEKRIVGFFVSGHPLEKFSKLVKDFIHGDITVLSEDFDKRKAAFKPRPKQLDEMGRPVWDREGRNHGKYDTVTAAIVSSVREITTKKGDRMAFLELEDERSKIEAVAFPEAYGTLNAMIARSVKECMPCIITGQIDLNEEGAKIFLRGMDSIEDFQAKRVRQVVFKIPQEKAKKPDLARLREVLLKHRGKVGVVLELDGRLDAAAGGTQFFARHQLPAELSVNPTAEMAREVNALFGESVVKFV